MIIKKHLFIVLSLLMTANLLGQGRAVLPQIKSLRVRYVDDQQRAEEGETVTPTRPYLVLGGLEGSPTMWNSAPAIDGTDPLNTLEISFDEMSHDVHQYTYSVSHRNADWTESSLTSGEFVHGFTRQDITDYIHSLNTSRAYTHYRFTFPNEDMTITASGNYLLTIYEDGDDHHIVAEIRVRVVDPKVKIGVNIRPNTDIELSGRYQQLDIDVNTSTITLTDPSEIKMIVQQNGRYDNEVIAGRPTYIQPMQLSWTNQKSLIFEGGNEYHHFDSYSTYLAGTHIDRVVYDNNDYHALLDPDEMRGIGAKYAGGIVTDKCGTPYIHEYDVDGQWVINSERTSDADSEGEYMWVHWVLPCDEPWMDGTVYVGGDLFGNQVGVSNRMEYDYESRCYWLTSLVKQGGYDYQYWFYGKGSQKKVTLQRTEGSHWETENEYDIFVYYRPFGARYDQLIGVNQAH